MIDDIARDTHVTVGDAENEKDGDDEQQTANEEPNDHQKVSQQDEKRRRDATRNARPGP